MSLTFNMVGGGGGLKNTDAVLVVTVPTGSTVTAAKGGTTLTTTMWVKAADATLDCAIFSIPASQFDSTTPWTITATLGTNTASTTVLIMTNKEYEVELSYLVPAEYQAVLYLERPINQLVRYDTGITPISTDFVAIRFEVLQTSSTPALCGAYNSGSSRWYMTYPSGVYYAYSGSMEVSKAYSLNTIYEAQFVNGNTFRWSTDGGETFTDQTVSGMGNAPYSFALFTMKNGPSSYLSDNYAHSVRIYSATVQDAEFVPCYRKSDNAPGFWNKRDSIFLENLGNGTVVVGPDL